MVDIARIEELYEEIGQDAVMAVLDVFSVEARVKIDSLATTLSKEEHAAAIHFLRSGALNLGLNSLAEAAESASVVMPGDRDRIARDMRRILDRSARLLNLADGGPA